MKNRNKVIKNFLLLFSYTIASQCYGQTANKTEWFRKSSFGLLVHYLQRFQNLEEPWNQGKATSWDSCVNSFNVNKFANDVAETGAGYVIFTTQQNNQAFSCPNSTFEKITGYKRGTVTPNRDLINEIYEALHKKGIFLMLYVTGNGPFADPKSMNALTHNSYKTRADKNYGNIIIIDTPFLNSWSLVLKDISMRYKSKIKGWWVDGAYSFIGYNDTSLAILSKALKAGNKNAIVAFNQAPRAEVSYYTKLDDYTAGEMGSITSYPKERFIKQAQWHAVTFLGKDWAEAGLRFTDKEVEDYIIGCNKKGGVVTLDVCLLRDGSLNIEQKQLFKRIKNSIKKQKAENL